MAALALASMSMRREAAAVPSLPSMHNSVSVAAGAATDPAHEELHAASKKAAEEQSRLKCAARPRRLCSRAPRGMRCYGCG